MEGPIVLSVFVMLSRLLARVVLPPRMFWRNGVINFSRHKQNTKSSDWVQPQLVVELLALRGVGPRRAGRTCLATTFDYAPSDPVRLPALTKATCSREDFGMLVRSVLPRLIIVL